MLKMYVMDCGVFGSITVIEESEDAAREIMKGSINYDEAKEIEVIALEKGACFCNLGDS